MKAGFLTLGTNLTSARIFLVAGAVFAVLSVLPAGAQTAKSGKTVLDGVYSQAQAARGKELYENNCAECHEEGAAFDGPALIGAGFVDRWREDSLDTLFTYIRTSMPADEPGQLSEAVYRDVVAYLLQANGLPAGNQELTTDVIRTTLFTGRDGPKPLPTNTTVQVAGCFTPETENTATLSNSGDPRRAREATKITPDEIGRAGAIPPGARSFRLQNLGDLSAYKPDSFKGHQVLVKGVLIRGSENDRINVTALESIGAGCSK
jgi:mono/diheme cytochrome c family protein